MSNGENFPTINLPSINDIHDEALIQHFREFIGHKMLAIMPSFPFIFIGEICDVIEDHIVIDVETTMISNLEDKIWFMHVHEIELFYIERDGGPRIPELRDDL